MAKVSIKIKLSLKFIAILLILVLIGLGITFYILHVSSLMKEKKQILSDVEYIYYYLKNEPTNLRLFGAIEKGDGVARSAWENYFSNSDSEIKKLSGLLAKNKEKIKKFKELSETKLFDKLQLSLDKFKKIRDESEKRVWNNSSFSEEKLKNLEKELDNILKEIRKEAKSLGLDLR